MADQDSYVQVAADGAGKKVDNTVLTRPPVPTAYAPPGTAGETVYRQRVVLSADDNPRLQALVAGEAGKGYLLVDSRAFDELHEKLNELMERLEFLLD